MQQIDPIPSEDHLIFSASLRPHRALSPRGLVLVMGFTACVGLGVSIPFFLMGAWPVVAFMGLDVALIYLAFRINNRAARACEQVFLSRIDLLVRAISWHGRVREARLNPLWTRLEREDHPEFGLERLTLVQGRTRVEVATCLGRHERAEFADAFQQALHRSRR